jgi:N-acetylglutamate synthase-like GNAT family acetyltransferase
MVTIRKALKKDAPGIRALIWQVQINPFGLNWQHFLVAVDEQERVVATGQIKPHRDGTLELASIATHPNYRGQGLASEIISRLIQESPRPIYLHCREKMEPYYNRFGFSALAIEEMPPAYAREMRMMDRARRTVARQLPRLLVMRLE